MSLTGSESDGSFQACLQLLAGDLLLSYFPPRVCYPSVQCSSAVALKRLRCTVRSDSGRHRVVPLVQCAQTHTLARLPGVFSGSASIAVIGRKKTTTTTKKTAGFCRAEARGAGWLFCDFCSAAGPKPDLKPPPSPCNTGLSRTPVCLNWPSAGR